MIPEKRLWQTVVFHAVLEALYEGNDREARMFKESADRWIRRAGRDFREACGLAGIDPDFLRDAYVAGKVDRRMLKSAEAVAA